MDSKQFDELVARLADGASRRDALKGIAGGALAAVGVTSTADAKGKKGRAGAEGKKKGKGRGGAAGAERHRHHKPKCRKRPKVTICHKGKTKTVSQCAVNKHIKRHGDTLGPCYGDYGS